MANGDIAKGRRMHRSIVFVGIRRIGEQALDRTFYFAGSLLATTDHSCEALRHLSGSSCEIFSKVVEHLCTKVRRAGAPTSSRVRGLHRIPNVFAVSARRLSQWAAPGIRNRDTVVPIRAFLFASDVELRGTINEGRARWLGRL